MKKQNIIALCLGVIIAAFLWEFYLQPKYDIRRGDEAVLQALYEADVAALQQATDAVGGEVLARSDIYYPGEDGGPQEPKDDVLSQRNPEDVDFDFSSAANKPRTLAQIAADGDKRRPTRVLLEDDDIVVKGKIDYEVPAGYAAEELSYTEEGVLAGEDPKSRFTMLLAPVKYHLLRDTAAYNKFLKEIGGGRAYNSPKVDFKTKMILFLESDSQLANGFFQIDSIETTEEGIIVNYKVNIIGSGERRDSMAYEIMPRSDKPIILRQVK